MLVELDDAGNPHFEMVTWQPQPNACRRLEDARALLLDDGRVLIGLTVVESELADTVSHVPYPAIAVLNQAEWRQELPETTVIKKFGPGKNLTPISPDTFLLRPEGPDNHHCLLVVGWDGQETSLIDQINFPTTIPWARWRIGTTFAPAWITTTEALLLIHGITIDETGTYIYSLGRAKLSRNGNYQVEVDPNPVLTPDHFTSSDGASLVPELHHSRKVVYACGGLRKTINGTEYLLVYANVGDSQTVEVLLPMKDLKRGWWD